MRRHLIATLSLALLFAGCSNQEIYQQRETRLLWEKDAAQQQAEQATLDKERARREVELAQRQVRVLNEKLALAYDALREARSRPDETLHDRMTELSQANAAPGGQFEISRWGGIVLESGIFFGSGRHELTTAGQQALGPLVERLLGDDYRDYDIELAGHSDSDPITRSADRYRDNHDLASLRANSVRRFLIERGVPAERVHLTAYGPNRPLGQDKAKDRRVEILLHKRTPEEALPASAPRGE